MRRLIAILFFSLCAAAPVSAEPVLKVINFTADWCPNCLALNPRLDEAIAQFERGSVTRIDVDATRLKQRMTEEETEQAHRDMYAVVEAHNVQYLWDWYGGRTGIAVVVAADNSEPIVCFMRHLSTEQIEGQLKLAKILAEKAPPGNRKPEGADCPVL